MSNRSDRIPGSSHRFGRQVLGDGKFALGALSGILLCLVAWSALGSSFARLPPGDLLVFIPSVVALVVAGVSALISYNAFLEQRRARQAGTDPEIVVHFGQRVDARELVTLNLTNIGAGAALDVKLEVEEPAVEVARYQLLTNVFKRHHPFRVILQGKTIEFSLAMGFNLFGDSTLPPFKASVAYSDIEGGRYATCFTLDIREMEQLGSHRTVETRQAIATESISKSLERGTRQLDNLLVDVSDIKDRVHRMELVAHKTMDKE
ncbi:hypothetical protein [Rhodobacteraceae bacterium W635]|uniref:hypothetical protein n=1 Tax=Nioella halotolerans TaxID=2303578 RepID=UPI0011C18E5B